MTTWLPYGLSGLNGLSGIYPVADYRLANPVVFYRLNANVSGDLLDSSGNDRHMDLTTVGTFTAGGLLGLNKWSNGDANLPSETPFTSNVVTVSLWFQEGPNIGASEIQGSWSFICEGDLFSLNAFTRSGSNIGVLAPDAGQVFTTSTGDPDHWHHAMMVYDCTNNRERVWLNGVLESDVTATLEIDGVNGCQMLSAVDQIGNLVLCGLWDGALGQVEAERLYNAGAGFDPTA